MVKEKRKRGITYQFKGYLSKRGHEVLEERLTQNRRLYNAALEERIGAYRQGRAYGSKHPISYYSQNKELTGVRADDGDMADCMRRVQVATLQRLDLAFKAFFRRVKAGETPGFPRFKGAARFKTLEWHSGYEKNLKLDRERGKGWIRAKGMPRVEFKLSRELPDGQPETIRITKTARRVVVSLVYVLDDLPVVATGTPDSPVGLDVGVSRRATLSTGGSVTARDLDRRRLKRLQRKVSRAKRGSGSRRKKVNALAREWQRVREAGRGAVHELSAELVKGHDYIAVEDLNIRNMMASAKGTVEEPGSGVKQKAGLNRSIGDQSWGRFIEMLVYKAEWAGTRVVKVDPKNTSRTCYLCGTIDGSSRRSQSEFVCVSCGYAANADVNAAQNILRRGWDSSFGPVEAMPVRAASNFRVVGRGARRTPRSRGATASMMLPGLR